MSGRMSEKEHRMLHLKRSASALLACAWPLLMAPLPASAAYPDRPIKLVVGYTPGSAADVAGRIAAEEIGRLLGQRLIIENKPGAASNTAAESVARSEPDGYTLFLSNIANAINSSLKKGSSIDLLKELRSIALVCSLPTILVVAPAIKAQTVAELIALAKADPDKLLFGSSGHGTAPHLSGELFASMAAIKIVHVPFSGSAQPVQEMIGGRLHLMFAPSSTVLGQIEAGTVRALAWSTPTRGPALPNLPTVAESGLPGFDTSIWFGFSGPAGLPDPIRDQLAQATAAAIKSDVVLKAFRAQGIEPLSGGPDAFQAYIAQEVTKWADVVAKAGLVKP